MRKRSARACLPVHPTHGTDEVLVQLLSHADKAEADEGDKDDHQVLAAKTVTREGPNLWLRRHPHRAVAVRLHPRSNRRRRVAS